MRGAFRHSFVLAWIGVLAALILAVMYLQAIGDRAIYPSFRFVVPNATAYVGTGPLRELWSHGSSHLSRVFSNAASDETKRFVKNLRNALADRCMTLDDLSNLSTLGIDETRGAAVTVLENERSVVVALPVSNQDSFLKFTSRLFPARIVLSKQELPPAADADDPKPDTPESKTEDTPDTPNDPAADVAPKKVAKQIRIDASEVRGFENCRDGIKEPTVIKAGETLSLPEGDESIQYYVSFADPTATARVQCTIVFEDGTTGNCQCRIAEYDCSAEARALPALMSEKLRKGELVALDSLIALHWTEETMLIVRGSDTQDIKRLSDAAASTRDNFNFFRGDDTLRTALLHLSEIDNGDEGAIVGAVAMPFLPFAGRAHFILTVGAAQLKTRLLLPWQTLQSRLLEQISTPPPEQSAARLRPLSLDAQIQFNDPWLGYYLRFVEGYSDWSQVYLKKLGSFLGFVQEIMKLEDVGPSRLAARGVRDGVPDVIMSLAVPRVDAETLIASQRARMREVRDREVLWSAAQKYIEEHPDETPTEMAELDPYLEDKGLLERYKIASDVKWNRPASMHSAFEPSETASTEFPDSEYTLSRGDRVLLLVQPPITADDVTYRVATGADKKIDLAELQSERFRLAAYIDDANQRLLVANNAEALDDFLRSDRSSDAPSETTSVSARKISVTGDPKYLINQGLIHPDKSVNEFITRYLLDFEQYRLMEAWFDPLPSQRGISATVILSHER